MLDTVVKKEAALGNNMIKQMQDLKKMQFHKFLKVLLLGWCYDWHDPSTEYSRKNAPSCTCR